MPPAPALMDHASSPGTLPHQPRETGDALHLGAGVGKAMSSTRRQKDPAVCPTDDEATVPHAQRQQRNKQSLDYLWRSGVAGGFAGCAVSCFGPLFTNIFLRAETPVQRY